MDLELKLQERLNSKLQSSIEINISEDGYYSLEPTGRKIFTNLPPVEDKLFYPAFKYGIINRVVTKKQPVFDENNQIVRDENRQIIYEEVNVTMPEFGWVLDSEKYAEIESNYLELKKEEMIQENKNNLGNFLSTVKMTSSAHGGIPEEYTVTEKKQSQLANMILSNQFAVTLSMDNKLMWNATGKECTEWTIEELSQLALEMKAFVYPYVNQQQRTEIQIKNAQSLEELNKIDITFKLS